MVNFPFICSNISAAPEDGIYIYQLIRKYNFELSCVHDHDSLFYLEVYTDTHLINTTEGTIKSRQSRETGKIGNTRHKTKTNKTKTQHNMCWTLSRLHDAWFSCVRSFGMALVE